MNEQFKEYVTSSAFRLDLSKNMIEFLLLVDVGEAWRNSLWAMAEPACTRRGLVIRVPIPGKESHSKSVLTPAGKYVVELLKIAGFNVERLQGVM